jgi:hypothetical protein
VKATAPIPVPTFDTVAEHVYDSPAITGFVQEQVVVVGTVSVIGGGRISGLTPCPFAATASDVKSIMAAKDTKLLITAGRAVLPRFRSMYLISLPDLRSCIFSTSLKLIGDEGFQSTKLSLIRNKRI